MTKINWAKPFPVSSSTFGDLLLPTYGNYGGANYSEGTLYGVPDWSGDPLNPYLTVAQLREREGVNSSNDALDRLDYLFYKHDVASMLADTVAEQTKADVDLLKGVVGLSEPTGRDAGESLYAGFTTLAMLQQLADNNQLGKISATFLYTALQDAVTDIQYGLKNLPPSEVQTALNTIFEYDADDDLFHFDFKVTTSSSSQEVYEGLAMNALNIALDGKEKDNEKILDTSGTTTVYNLTFDRDKKDLDLHAGPYDVA